MQMTAAAAAAADFSAIKDYDQPAVMWTVSGPTNRRCLSVGDTNDADARVSRKYWSAIITQAAQLEAV